MTNEKQLKLLRLLEKNAKMDHETIADALNLSVEDVTATIKKLETKGIIASYHTIVDWDQLEDDHVSAMVEVNVNLDHETSYDTVAKMLYGFDEIESLYLTSGSYDYMVLTKRTSMSKISSFINKLAMMDEVQSTVTHIAMKRYKDHNVILDNDGSDDERLVIS